MPDGRFLSKSISDNEHLGTVSAEAALLFSWCIPHLDRDGRLDGRPRVIKSRVMMWRDDIGEGDIPALLRELSPLVKWYECDGTRVLWFPGFRGEQKGDAWYNKEAESRLPPHSGDSLDLLLTDSGPSPDPVGVREVEVKAQVEVKETTGAVPPELVVGKSKEEPPAFTQNELLDLSHTELGKGTSDRFADKRILNHWLFSLGRDPMEIWCFIKGASKMRDLDLIGWDSAKPGMSMGLKSGNGPMTVADQGDGTVLRDFYDVAIEYWRKHDVAPTRRAASSKHMGRLSVAVTA